ncbi:MAG: hypothetical protein A3G33_05715 [Omnitrophica bacterium RIFCSPLOWO2_12_FULL_44_17]|uniref:Diguanylate cyclase n=1 Tax=Candidatus Danuiimicrobium aquiferis TaxID=1801832 RepID=A0A1G1L363_9BACT|nr:MAG: hypothetical protein A3B72_05195 [Omnitrophica bacterium RIFCSPHIGHO2_02_FULL_45_28]OGW99568.1 MAG: hypothetical protein A3G33_05715 [Omnitrophica bacterium RIFCSPLOWO2_12_FULL_44_17]OGX04017.1 MAG: hypothetical protein A3J12_06255 [Omnitrophica bacterium RIFCSPLOWO2_02_FULL_44_11]
MKILPSRILIVEDNPDHVEIIQCALQKWAESNGIQIEFSESMSEAFAQANVAQFDLILTDYYLPDGTGSQLVEALAAQKYPCAFLLMTAAGDEALAVRALKTGFRDYIIKKDSYAQKLAATLETAYVKYREEEKKKQEQERLTELSVRDSLTNLYNVRFLQERMAEEYARAARYHHPLSCLMIDIDHFKNVNDLYGHQTGDELLRELSGLLLAHVRQSDVVVRYGGEEFVILAPHVGYYGAQILAERLRIKVVKSKFISHMNPVEMRISIGIAVYPEDPAKDKDSLLFFADQALYRAKQLGRNQVCLYQQSEHDAIISNSLFVVDKTKMGELSRRLSDISNMAKKAYIEGTRAFVEAVEMKSLLNGHSARTAMHARSIAEVLGIREEEVCIIEHAALLHDIGKLCIPAEILRKADKLTGQEYEIIKIHSVLGYQMVKPIAFLSEESLMILHHHEWYDGRGYPHGLKAKSIPIGARIIAVADAYDSMCVTGIGYRNSFKPEEAVRELINYAGIQFDPEMVQMFIQALVKKGDLEPQAYDSEKLGKAIQSVSNPPKK